MWIRNGREDYMAKKGVDSVKLTNEAVYCNDRLNNKRINSVADFHLISGNTVIIRLFIIAHTYSNLPYLRQKRAKYRGTRRCAESTTCLSSVCGFHCVITPIVGSSPYGSVLISSYYTHVSEYNNRVSKVDGPACQGIEVCIWPDR